MVQRRTLPLSSTHHQGNGGEHPGTFYSSPSAFSAHSVPHPTHPRSLDTVTGAPAPSSVFSSSLMTDGADHVGSSLPVGRRTASRDPLAALAKSEPPLLSPLLQAISSTSITPTLPSGSGRLMGHSAFLYSSSDVPRNTLLLEEGATGNHYDRSALQDTSAQSSLAHLARLAPASPAAFYPHVSDNRYGGSGYDLDAASLKLEAPYLTGRHPMQGSMMFEPSSVPSPHLVLGREVEPVVDLKRNGRSSASDTKMHVDIDVGQPVVSSFNHGIYPEMEVEVETKKHRNRNKSAMEQEREMHHIAEESETEREGKEESDSDGHLDGVRGDGIEVEIEGRRRNTGSLLHYCQWEDCSARFDALAALVSHITQEHISKLSAATQYICRWSGCPRMQQPQASRFSLQSHMRTHTGERPFSCKYCGADFPRSDACAKHVRTQHEEKKEPSTPPVKKEVGSNASAANTSTQGSTSGNTPSSTVSSAAAPTSTTPSSARRKGQVAKSEASSDTRQATSNMQDVAVAAASLDIVSQSESDVDDYALRHGIPSETDDELFDPHPSKSSAKVKGKAKSKKKTPKDAEGHTSTSQLAYYDMPLSSLASALHYPLFIKHIASSQRPAHLPPPSLPEVFTFPSFQDITPGPKQDPAPSLSAPNAFLYFEQTPLSASDLSLLAQYHVEFVENRDLSHELDQLEIEIKRQLYLTSLLQSATQKDAV